MFIGHFGVGFGAKKYAPGLSLGVLFIAAQFLDLLWPSLLLAGVEEVRIAPGITRVTPLDFVHYPVTHSLLMAVAWGIGLAILTWGIVKKTRPAVVMFVCVVSHWILDFFVHRPDLPLYPGGSVRAGLGLWNDPLITAVLEATVFAVGVMLYVRTTVPKNKKGTRSLWMLILLLAAIQTANMTGPPPPDLKAIAWAGHLQWLFVLLAFYVDRNRRLRTSAAE
jgi:membrane-bound metal-dependent hydrolase YbcI (DUF457 family)